MVAKAKLIIIEKKKEKLLMAGKTNYNLKLLDVEAITFA